MNLDSLKLLLDSSRLQFYLSLLKILALTITANKTWTRSSKRFFKSQKTDHHLGISSKLSPLTSIIVGLTWNVITFINNVKNILPSLESLDQTKFRLQLFFFRIRLTSAGNSTKRSWK